MTTEKPARQRVILHVDMDAFYASVEMRDNPQLKGKPVVVGAGPHERGVVAAASYEARKFGIHSAMPSREAGRRCPHAIFIPPRMERYNKVSGQVFKIFERFTPTIEPLSIDEAFLDVTGAIRLFGSGIEIARRIRSAIQEELDLTASVGVATNMFLAKLASDINKPDGLTVVPSDRETIRRFLGPLPVDRLWGVGKTTKTLMDKAKLRTIGDIQKTTFEHLASFVGLEAARHFKQLADGEDNRVVETESEEKSISRENTFPKDCSDPELVRKTLLELVDDVGIQLRETGKYAAVAQIKIRWKGFETITRQKTLSSPIFDDVGLQLAALELLSKVKLVKPVRLVGFGVTNLVHKPADRQMTLFESSGGDRTRQERLSRTVDAIRKKHGSDSIRRLHD
jgi:DNA polymerase-4